MNNRIEMTNIFAIAQTHSGMDDFDTVAQEVSRTTKVQNEVTTNIKEEGITEEDTLSPDEILEMITPSFINATVRQMKQNEERLNEILNED
ncbi:hypothetical protein IG557_17225 [Vibrio cholerae]|uniref:hypothetical protein n=1 Tax=Vibrio cholerae TaxID=666 RepID=UPI002271F571|nr:hypothetical protein [Vibrio cholerae]MCX9560583.1 hypothetical protein [Vibrio cholerae]MCX9560963.1 hypothetical protein [Vibrio cholerae]